MRRAAIAVLAAAALAVAGGMVQLSLVALRRNAQPHGGPVPHDRAGAGLGGDEALVAEDGEGGPDDDLRQGVLSGEGPLGGQVGPGRVGAVTDAGSQVIGNLQVGRALGHWMPPLVGHRVVDLILHSS